jgi:hypothetical protein
MRDAAAGEVEDVVLDRLLPSSGREGDGQVPGRGP